LPLLILLASMIVSDCAGVVAKPVGVGHGETRSLTKDRHAGRRITYANPRRSAGGKNVPKLSRMIHDGGADKTGKLLGRTHWSSRVVSAQS